MKKVRIINKWVLILVCCVVAGLSANDSSAALTSIGDYQAEALLEPTPPVLPSSGSIVYYKNYLIYAGDDGKIYGYNLDSFESDVISDTSSLFSDIVLSKDSWSVRTNIYTSTIMR